MAPFLDLVHIRERRCEQCTELLAQAGSRSFIVDAHGDPIDFDLERPPQAMQVCLHCALGHKTMLAIPDDVGAEATMMTPEDAPIAVDAQLTSLAPSSAQ